MSQNRPPRPIALTIAGFDPGSGAGITADLKVFAAHGLYGVSCISALTVQSTLGVRSVEPLTPGLIQSTLDCLAQDMAISGVKIGMLGSAGVAGEVSGFLASQSQRIPPDRVVLDPVLCSSSGAALIDPDGVRRIRETLLQQVGWITPNLDELAILIGQGDGPVDRSQIPAASARLQKIARQLGNPALNVVVTGGHLDRPDDFLLTANGAGAWLPGEKIETQATHGTGCAFSSALLCELISGQQATGAVLAAKAYVTAALRSAYPVGKGKGPMNHLFPFDPS